MPAISTVAGTHGYGRAGKTQSESPILQYVEVASPNYSASQWVVKYTGDGNILWRASILGSAGQTFVATGISIPTSACTSDAAGNIYVVGYFVQIHVVFYNSNGTVAGTLNNLGGNDAFLVKYNRFGTVQWFARIVSSTVSDLLTTVTTDTNGNVYVGGSFVGTGTFYDTRNIAYRQFVSAGNSDAFVAKLNSNGIFQWIGILSAPTGTDRMGAIITDPSGNLYLACDYSGTSTLLTTYNGVTSTGTLTAFGSALTSLGGFSAAFIKYNSNGVIQWRSRFGTTAGVGSGSITGIVANATFTNFFISASYNGTLQLYDTTVGGLWHQSSASSGYEPAVINYDSTGFPFWFLKTSSTGIDSGNAIAIDSADNLYLLTNQAATTSLFNRNEGLFVGSIPSGQFVIKYNWDGYVQWYGRFTGSVPTGIARDSSDNLYITLHSTAQFIYTSPSSLTTSGPFFYGGANDMTLVKLNSGGEFVWSTRIVSANQAELSMGVSSDSLGNMIVMGTVATVSYPNSTILYNADATIFSELPPALFNTTDVFLAQYTTLGVGRWAARIGSLNGTTTSRSVTTQNGDVYVIGQNLAIPLRAFGATSGYVKTINTLSPLNYFFAKYNAIGQTEWMVRISSSVQIPALVVSNIITDSAGNVYVGIYFPGPITFYGSNDVFYTVTPTRPTVVVIKYNKDGIIQWYVNMTSASPGGTLYRVALTVDSGNNLIVTGLYEGTNFTFVNSDGSTFATALVNAGSSDGFLVKYTSSGFVTWVTRYTGTNTEYGTQVDVDSSNNIYIAGLIGTASLLFYNSSAPNGTSAATLVTQSTPDAFVVKYNSSGTYQWSYRLGGTGTETATGLTVDNAGNSYLIATYTGASTTTFPSPSFTLPTPVGTDIVVIKYDTSGAPQWFVRVTGAGTEVAGHIACDKITGSVYFVGQLGLSGATVVDASGNTIQSFVPEASNNDGFLVSMNTNGTLAWAVRTGGVNAENITGVGVDAITNSVVITGTYTLTGAWACSKDY